MYKGEMWIPNALELKRLIMDEFHKRSYSSHPCYPKKRIITRNLYYRPKMKKKIATYIFKECQQSKVEYKNLERLLQKIPIREWK